MTDKGTTVECEEHFFVAIGEMPGVRGCCHYQIQLVPCLHELYILFRLHESRKIRIH